ncbi:hypothetical protein Bca52824_057873 [Brassica carinata]|uniref:Disease resistance protein n=1 Tax=Brassica carinata TaxID=52824 RepID=A0A8X7QRU7_BRACI|nr:hypothetical protein Bca52824_057873 [Brassica carinata]
MPFLSTLHLSNNHLTDSLETMNCSSSSKLETIYLSNNYLSGRILEPLSKFTNLKELYLSFQNTTGAINFFSLGFKSLELNPGSPNLKELVLNNCNIEEFPTFMKNLTKLVILRTVNNRLKGEVPKWLWSMPSLSALFLSHNSLNSFSIRHLTRSFPVISPRLSYVLASDNSFTGEIPLSLCNQTYLNLLNLAHNNFSGSIPRCLIISVQDVDLGNNNLIGRLPDSFYKLGFLRTRTLDVSNNQITGKLPRSLTNCTSLEYLNVEGNRIPDTFPFWLEELPKLKIIVLRSNMFHGPIYSPQHPLSFPELRMFDISQSCFQDKVPSTPEAQEPEPSKQEQVFNWKAAAMGYGPGVLFDFAIGQVLYSYKPVLFFKLFRL